MRLSRTAIELLKKNKLERRASGTADDLHIQSNNCVVFDIQWKLNGWTVIATSASDFVDLYNSIHVYITFPCISIE